jgi:hypothetical protein
MAGFAVSINGWIWVSTEVDRVLSGSAKLKPLFEDHFIELTLTRRGRIVVRGEVLEYSEHVQHLRFEFETDQTVLKPLIDKLRECLRVRLGVVFPDDVRMLVSAFNGSENSTDVDHGWVMFWPLSDWQEVTEEPAAIGGSDMPNAILFADHSIVSWWYAIDVTPDALTTAVYLIDGMGPDHLVASSISGVLQAIIDDSDALYRRAASPH